MKTMSGSRVRSSFTQHGRYFVKNGNDPDAKSERLLIVILKPSHDPGKSEREICESCPGKRER